MPSAEDMLSGVNKINRDLINQYMGQLPEDLPPEQRTAFLNKLIDNFSNTDNIVEDLSGNAKMMQESLEENLGKGTGMSLANGKIFSLSKLSQMGGDQIPQGNPLMQPEPNQPFGNPELGLQDPNQPPPALNKQGPNGEMLQFNDATAVRNYLETTLDVDQALNTLLSLVSDERTEIGEDSGKLINPKQIISDSVKTYFEGKDTMSDQEKLKVASAIFEALPQSVKSAPMQDESSITAVEQRVASIVRETEQIIRKSAQILANNKEKKFNLKKTAQHKGFDNVILVGPGQTRVDAFTGNLISDLHLIERNKGFGLKIDDVLNVDWEAIWRGSVMDKYSREYRDEDGKWVGGYLNKRFEIDQNIPEGNDYQLKPGQKRRPYLPQYRSLESRLEAMRETEGEKRGYGPSTSGKPFNWKEAQQQKKSNLKTADDGLLSFLSPKASPTPQTGNAPAPVNTQTSIGSIGQPVKNNTYKGPQPGIDIKENDRVILFSKHKDGRTQEDGRRGKVLGFQGQYQGVPLVRVKVDNEPGIATWPIDQMKPEMQAVTASLDKSALLRPMAPLDDPFTSKEDQKFNRISRSKTCPSCNSTNDAGNAKCSNCGMNLTNVGLTYHPHHVSPKGKQNKKPISVNPNQRVAGINQIVPQRPLSPRDKLLVSDPEAENLNEEHLDDVQSSADHLGL